MSNELSIGERMREAFGDLDMRSALRLLFNKCPECGTVLARGNWLRYCPDRSCHGYCGPLNQSLGNKVAYVKPRTELEELALKRLADQYGDLP